MATEKLDGEIRVHSSINSQPNHSKHKFDETVKIKSLIMNLGQDDDMLEKTAGNLDYIGDFNGVVAQEHELVGVLGNLNICVVCEKIDDRVLLCSGNDCALAFHRSCLTLSLKLDDSGNVYCPYCRYKLLVSRSEELRRNVTEKRKAFLRFDCSKVSRVGEEEAELESNNVSHSKCISKNGQLKVAKAKLVKRPLEVSSVGEDVEELELNEVSVDKCRNENADVEMSNQGVKLVKRPWTVSELVGKKGNIAKSSIPSPPQKNENEMQIVVYSRKRQRSKRVRWSEEEEAMLKKGVCIYSKKINKNMPWRAILQFGCAVFHSSRSPSDLKEKWKNMLAKNK